MNRNLIYRILGAFSSALIVVSVFLTYYSLYDYSFSLWGANSETNSLYLPIMIIVFGAIGVILFAANLKTEFVYATTGAILFYIITETFNYIRQDSFGDLNIGYYLLVIGCVMTGIMTFITTSKNKIKKIEPIDSSVTDQANKLYETANIITDQQNASNQNDNQIGQIPDYVFNIPIVEPLNDNPNIEEFSNNNQADIFNQQNNDPIIEPIKESQVLEGLNTPIAPINEPTASSSPVESMKQNPALQGLNIPISPINEPTAPSSPVEPMNQNPALQGLNVAQHPVQPSFNSPIVGSTNQTNDVTSLSGFTGETQPQQNNSFMGSMQQPNINTQTQATDIFNQPFN